MRGGAERNSNCEPNRYEVVSPQSLSGLLGALRPPYSIRLVVQTGTPGQGARNLRSRALFRGARTSAPHRGRLKFAAPQALAFSAAGGALRGHADGVIIAAPPLPGAYLACPAVWEHKAVNAKNWRAVERDGLEKVFPQYLAQVVIYQAYLRPNRSGAVQHNKLQFLRKAAFPRPIQCRARAAVERPRGQHHRSNARRRVAAACFRRSGRLALPHMQSPRAMLAMKNELLNEALGMIRAAGFRPSVVRNRHWKVSWVDQRGHMRRLVIAFSPSDRRAQTQARAVLRRLLAP